MELEEIEAMLNALCQAAADLEQRASSFLNEVHGFLRCQLKLA